jgi:hypothetical protein
LHFPQTGVWDYNTKFTSLTGTSWGVRGGCKGYLKKVRTNDLYLQLAQFVVYGLPDALQDRINEQQLLEVTPFSYGPFEKQANMLFLTLQRPAELSAPARATSSAPPTLS